jgi:dihydrolipoamide dehydrogenase
VVEFLDRILPGTDADVARSLQRILAKQGMSFKLSSKVTGIARTATGHKIAVEPASGDGAGGMVVEADVVLVAIGRVPYTEGLGLEALGIARDNRGFIRVDERFETNVPGIFAIGDAIPGPMLAHKAEDEGVACAEMMAGQKPHIDYDAILSVVYTWPEAASVGKTEEQLKKDGVAYRVGKFPLTANSRARANGETEGLVKLLADAKTDRLLGAHIVAGEAGTMIAELALAMEFSASAEDIARTCHAHPTLSEAVKEAALAVAGRAIHI